MLSVMLMRMQEADMSEENLRDLVGESANTFAGNARRDFGQQFQISVPQVVAGQMSPPQFPRGTRPIVIPIDWRTYKARLVVCLG
jgi:chemotaxis protein CheX